ncbi:MAG: DUF2071 domain-containing protein [Verrucomicrobiaceae bacterium]|nr:DUF2071 domain-containing protein [Verrucomicrobiaceae bacterium]
MMFQSWEHLLFLHWEIDAKSVQATLPPGLFVDTHEHKAYIGIVPFCMRRIRPRFLPSVPYVSNFLECNVRTYVHDAEGVPGVWFYSLDTDRWFAHWLARTFFHLPYFWASMGVKRTDKINYEVRRRDQHETSHYLYSPVSEEHPARPESLDFFLLERYLLYAHSKEKEQLYRGRVHHARYQVSEVNVPTWDTLPISWNGLPEVLGNPIHTCTSRRVDVEIFGIEKL